MLCFHRGGAVFFHSVLWWEFSVLFLMFIYLLQPWCWGVILKLSISASWLILETYTLGSQLMTLTKVGNRFFNIAHFEEIIIYFYCYCCEHHIMINKNKAETEIGQKWYSKAFHLCKQFSKLTHSNKWVSCPTSQESSLNSYSIEYC